MQILPVANIFFFVSEIIAKLEAKWLHFSKNNARTALTTCNNV